LSRWIDVDEKWFFSNKTKRSKKMPGHVTTPKKFGNKLHLEKVMVLTAIAGTCDAWPADEKPGLIGCYRIASLSRPRPPQNSTKKAACPSPCPTPSRALTLSSDS